METNFIAPAPWTLNGNGVVLLYRFPSQFIQEFGFLNDFQNRGYKSGFGAVMLMDYKTSGVGPYRELLFLPGLFNIAGKLAFSISKIYVSTYDSVMSGKRNWGIPKELADFKIETTDDGCRKWQVRKDGSTFFESILQPSGISFPISSRIFPHPKIIQKGGKHFLLTLPEISGKAKRAILKNVYSEPAHFPPIHLLKPIFSFYLKDFIMNFPVALQLGKPFQKEPQPKKDNTEET